MFGMNVCEGIVMPYKRHIKDNALYKHIIEDHIFLLTHFT